MANTEKLKPCPFCEKAAVGMHKRRTVTGSIVYWVECEIFGCRRDDEYSKEEAIELWNTRAESDLLKSIRAAYKESKSAAEFGERVESILEKNG